MRCDTTAGAWARKENMWGWEFISKESVHSPIKHSISVPDLAGARNGCPLNHRYSGT
jgi:hypothetical protein